MSIDSTEARPDARAGRPRVPWSTVALLTVVMAYGDGFWLTSLQGAIGAVERAGGPIASWLRVSTLMAPAFGFAVWKALTAAQRRYGPELHTPRTVVAAALLVAVAGSVVGIGGVAASSAYDYNLQSTQLQQTETTHAHPVTADRAQGVAGATAPGGAVGPTQGLGAGSCTATCQALRSTLAVHVRGVGYAGGVLLLTNVLLVGWVVALRGGRLGAAPGRRGDSRRQAAGSTARALGTGSVAGTSLRGAATRHPAR